LLDYKQSEKTTFKLLKTNTHFQPHHKTHLLNGKLNALLTISCLILSKANPKPSFEIKKA
jgi:hypothetical protein